MYSVKKITCTYECQNSTSNNYLASCELFPRDLGGPPACSKWMGTWCTCTLQVEGESIRNRRKNKWALKPLSYSFFLTCMLLGRNFVCLFGNRPRRVSPRLLVCQDMVVEGLGRDSGHADGAEPDIWMGKGGRGEKKTVSYHLVNVKVNVKNESTQGVTTLLPLSESCLAFSAAFLGGFLLASLCARTWSS